MGLFSWKEIINSPMAGALWETYSFSQIHRHLLSQGISSPPFFYWRTKDGREVDFVFEKGGGFIAFEAKLTGSPASDTEKGFEHLREYYGEDSLIKGFVICRVKKEFSIGKGIKAVNGTQFDF